MGHFLLAAAHSSSTTSNGTFIAILLSVLAVLPGLGAMWVSLKSRRDQSDRMKVESKKDLVELGANILTDEIERLTSERKQWESERHRWMEDKADLLQKVNHLSSQLDALNRYVIEVLALLRANNLEPPAPPRSLKLNGQNGHGAI